MTDIKHIIEPERLGLWVAATFVIALLALVLALVAYNRTNDLMYITQAEVLLLNKKLEAVNPSASVPAVSANQEEAK